MILITIGTNETPFDRLVAAAPRLLAIDDEVVVQAGPSAAAVPGCQRIDMVGFDEFVGLVRAARVVVSHAGVGSILTAVGQGRRPIVVPRRCELGEAVDDHQRQVARKLSGAGLVTVVEDERALADVARGCDPDLPVRGGAAGALSSDLGSYLDDLRHPGGRKRRRPGGRKRSERVVSAESSPNTL